MAAAPDSPLAGARIVVPESRELDLFVSMIERAGGTALRCPLVAILDLEDATEAVTWLGRLVAGEFDDVILYTGEGLRRLQAVAERHGMADRLAPALACPRKIVRGPKPARVLRTLGLGPDLSAEPATTEGLLALLGGLAMGGRRVGLQLYPDAPGTVRDALETAGATVDPVLPYRYATHEEDARVADTIGAMARGEVDMIALTSRPQVKRLREVAERLGLQPALREAAGRTLVAAVGPVTAQAARDAGWRVAAMPTASFHLKPMIAVMAEALAHNRDAALPSSS